MHHKGIISRLLNPLWAIWSSKKNPFLLPRYMGCAPDHNNTARTHNMADCLELRVHEKGKVGSYVRIQGESGSVSSCVEVSRWLLWWDRKIRRGTFCCLLRSSCPPGASSPHLRKTSCVVCVLQSQYPCSVDLEWVYVSLESIVKKEVVMPKLMPSQPETHRGGETTQAAGGLKLWIRIEM